MVPEEGQECPQLHPPVQQFLCRRATKPSDIRSDHWHLEKLVLQHALDASSQIVPGTLIITEPVCISFIAFCRGTMIDQ
jgi:hypothetical protein